MDARWFRAASVAAAVSSLGAVPSWGAGHRTPNFVVQAATPEIAVQVAEAAERFRRELAVEWLGREMPNWTHPCPIEVQVGAHLGAGGATTFMFDRGEAFGWRMNIQGSLERVLDSVLPHEVTHTVFASHFRQPLPRWADEGACSTVEHDSERQKQQRALIQYLKTRRGIPFSQMFAMKEYPQDILPLYAQGHSLAMFLIAQGGKQKYLKFVGAGLRGEQWTRATREFYGYEHLGELQNSWLTWVRQGSRLPLEPSAISSRSGAAVRDDLARVEPAPDELARVGPVRTDQDRVVPAELDPLRRPVPEDVEQEDRNTTLASRPAPVVPVSRGAVAKSKSSAPAAHNDEQVSVYENRARRRDTLRR